VPSQPPRGDSTITGNVITPHATAAHELSADQLTGWPAGLSDSEVTQRRAAGQGNEATVSGSTPTLRILRRNLFTILNGALFSVSLLLILLGRYLDAIFTGVPVAANVLVSVYLEFRAKRQLDRLTLIHTPRVTVLRDGTEHDIAPAQLVLGDVVKLVRGHQAVVDGRVLSGVLEIDESVLTGESVPVVKKPGDAVRSGSVVVAGSAAVEATQVGTTTFASRLAAEAKKGRDERTPLRRDLDKLILFIGMITVLVAIPVGLSLIADGETLVSEEAVRAAAVLVALVPQGLAIMATVTYSVAAVRVSRSGAIVQRIDAAESMSRVDVLCLDKTGTITTASLRLDRLTPIGDEPSPDLEARIGRAAASMEPRDRSMDAIAAAFPAMPAPAAVAVPFSSLRRWSGIAFGTEPTGLVFASPDRRRAEGSSDPIEQEVRRLSEEGRRVLLVMEVPTRELSVTRGDLPPGRVVAVLALEEETRTDAGETLDELRSRGLRLKLISGDDPRTVAAIAGRVGLRVTRTMSGSELATVSDEDMQGVAQQVDVFGRVQPEDKPRIVTALRQQGHSVGMVGDGVNDVLALRRADLGIAMESGSAAARAVAGLVLLGDKFGTLPGAITEGQRVVSAMIAVACLLLARTVYMLILIAAAAVAGLPFPFTPTTNAVLAMVTVGIPIFLLALWVPPVRAPRSVVSRTMAYAIPAGLVVSVFAVPLMFWAFATADVATARSIVTAGTVFAGIGLIPIMFPVVSDRSSPVGPGGDPRPAIMALAMLLLFAAIMAVPLARDIYGLVPLPWDLLGALLVLTVIWGAAVIAGIRLGLPQMVGRYLPRLDG
jgi:cation-transporting P-type ATPase E